jgi:hypothetical protein
VRISFTEFFFSNFLTLFCGVEKCSSCNQAGLAQGIAGVTSAIDAPLPAIDASLHQAKALPHNVAELLRCGVEVREKANLQVLDGDSLGMRADV